MSALRINLPGQPVRHLAPDGTAYVPSQGHSFRGAAIRPRPGMTASDKDAQNRYAAKSRAKVRALRKATA